MSEIDKTVVSIRFSGQDLDPNRIGELLCFGESGFIKTTVKRLKNGQVVWTIRLENDEPIGKKIETLLAQFTVEMKQWELITEKIRVDIFCGLFLDGWNQGFELTPNILSELSKRNLKIGFDIYAPAGSFDQFIEDPNNS